MISERTNHEFEPNLLIGPELLACQKAVENVLEQLQFPKLLVFVPVGIERYNPELTEIVVLKTSQTKDKLSVSVHLRKVIGRTVCDSLAAWAETVGTQKELVAYEEVPLDQYLATNLGIGQAIAISGSEKRLVLNPSLYFHKNGFRSATGSADSYKHLGGINSLLRKITLILSDRNYNKLVVGLPQT